MKKRGKILKDKKEKIRRLKKEKKKEEEEEITEEKTKNKTDWLVFLTHKT